MTFSEVTSVWGVSAVAILDCSLNVYACGRRKALTMPGYCVAANCHNSQTTQSITMHEFPRNRPAVRRKWVKFVQFKRADCCASITPICVASTSLSAILSTLWRNTKWDLLQSEICRDVHRVIDLDKIQV